MNVPAFPALDAVENLITELVNDNGWTYQYTMDTVEQDVFSRLGETSAHEWGIQELIDAHGAQAIEEAVRRLRR